MTASKKQAARLTKSLKNAILAHAEAEYPKESCGVVVQNKYIPCKNLSTNKDQFYIDPQDLIKAGERGSIQAYVHSHPNGSCKPSEPDRVGINLHGLPWIICGYPEGSVAQYKPDNKDIPLLGRTYHHGLQDCYSIVKDYYYRELGIILNDYERSDRWWESKENNSLYLDNFKKEGFIEIDDINDLRKHDAILFTIGKTEHINHAGVFLGDGVLKSEDSPKVIGNSLFIHHPYKKKSVRDIYGNFWIERTTKILRHKRLL